LRVVTRCCIDLSSPKKYFPLLFLPLMQGYLDTL
jgi:hypothetical protein